MQSSVDNLQDNLRLLSSLDLEEVLTLVAEIVIRICQPTAGAIVMWDSDLESFSECSVFGAKKKEFTKFVETFMHDWAGDLRDLCELDGDELAVDLPSDLRPVVACPLKQKGQLSACILLSGCQELDWSGLQSTFERHALPLALAHAFEYRELKRENERLRGQYEQLEDSIRAMEDQTRKLIHDVMAKDALQSIKLKRDRLVYSISNAVRSSVKIQEVLLSAVNQIGSSFGVTHCLLLRPVETAEQLVAFEYHNPYQGSIKDLFCTEAGNKFMRAAMKKEAPQVLGEPSQDSQDNYDRDFLKQLGLLSGLIVPLILRERVQGVIYLQECVAPREWNIDDMAVLGALADLLSVAIGNADLHEERERQAVTDGLTGVANRRHFNDVYLREFERARRYEHPLSLVVVDLDFLKKINDTYGHQAGDEAIKAIAGVMQQSSRSVDLAARYGGEEFCLLLPDTDLEMARQIAERLRSLIGDTKIEGPGCVTASLGVASFPQHAVDPEALFQQADEALYQAKQAGRNRVCIAGSAPGIS